MGISNIFSRIFLLTLLVLSLPLVILILLLALCYKILCTVIIKRKDKLFVSFLDSFDVFWSLEDDATKSIINVLGIVESDSSYIIADDIKRKLLNIFPNKVTRKIFYRRREEFGFHYWRQYEDFDVDQYVEVVELPITDINDDTRANVEELLTKLQEQSLPYDDEGLFKILITKQRVGNNEKEKGEYAIIFRIHHSVGDGVALINLLYRTLANQNIDSFAKKFSVPERNRNNSASNFFKKMHKLLKAPVCLVDSILRNSDKSALHGPNLLGKKVFKWTECDKNLRVLVKQIKDNANHLSFTDILLTALSSGLQDYFSQAMTVIPDDVGVIIPVRFTKSTATDDGILKNNFSVTIIDLPVRKKDLEEVKKRYTELRKSPDPLTNYYLLKLITGILPKRILQPILKSSKATMVFSNMPGPEQLSICGDFALKELVFFVPNKGNTGLGVTALCYGGVLRLAAMADTALVPTSEDLSVILEGMVREIKRLHKLYVNKDRRTTD